SRLPGWFSFGEELFAVVVGGIAVHSVDVQGRIAAEALGSVLDDKMWSLNAVIGGNVAAGLRGNRATPGEPGLVEIAFELRHAGGGGTFVNDVGPFRDHVEQHGALAVIHGGGFEALGLDVFAVLAGAQNEVGHAGTDNGALALRFLERVE